VIPAFRRLRQESQEFEASLGYIVRSSFNKTTTTKINKKKKKILIKTMISAF
jgi:hypothetical protein